MPLVILTGASGSGKTTLAKAVSQRVGESVDVHFFDSIDIPSFEEMSAQQGSIENWQRVKTKEWLHRLAPAAEQGEGVLFEGQMRIAFIEEALAAAAISEPRIILVDCSDEERLRRLNDERHQPELANPQMINWAKYLRTEALQGGHEILDTSARSVADCAAHLSRYF
ncbi:MAG: AAA family ATPase [Hyphomicrobiales bacterium]|nr:MAG: AAA family ATPase [Hyphomicrobiales bacterium]